MKTTKTESTNLWNLNSTKIYGKGWNWDETEQEHQELEVVDKALTRLGFFDE